MHGNIRLLGNKARPRYWEDDGRISFGARSGRNGKMISTTGLNISPRIIQPTTERFLRDVIMPVATVMPSTTASNSQCQMDRPSMQNLTRGPTRLSLSFPSNDRSVPHRPQVGQQAISQPRIRERTCLLY